MDKRPLISVIVPVYGTEKYLRKCLDSILYQTYKEIELIIVNDASKDNSEEIIMEYMNMDDRIKYVRHAKNRGLFQARISGAEEATGEYIAFVDSDDSLAIDYYRQAINVLLDTNADMVISNTVNVDENGWYNVNSIYSSLPYVGRDIFGEDIFRTYMEQEGSCFLWHTIWNKIYRKSLWDKCMPHYKEIKKHVIMTEDMAFSTILFYYAKHVTFSKCDGVFYYRHSEASTSAKKSKGQILKYIEDLACVFSFLEKFILNTVCIDRYAKMFESLKKRYFRIWCGNVTVSGFSEDAEVCAALYAAFAYEKFELPKTDEFYFYSAQTTWDSRLENLKMRILDSETKIVSFDVFDTLLYRPLWNPEDVFGMLNKYFHQLYSESKFKFEEIRKYSDTYARKKLAMKMPMLEDVSLEEIYEAMQELYDIPQDIVQAMLKKEIETEISLVYPRKTGVELLNMAAYVGKKVILVSDMYLSKNTIAEMLEKCNITNYDKLYVSSECRVLKRTGSLFRYVISDLDIKNEEETLIHIGDNWNSDVLAPQNLGMKAAFFPKAKEVFENGISDINTGECFNGIKVASADGINYANSINTVAMKFLLAIVANKLYDNPFRSMDKYTHYNCDPYFVGYYALGMHIVGIAKWILDEANKQNYDVIHFLSRDGFITQKVFDILRKVYHKAPKANYLHATRKSLIPMFVNNKADLYSLSEFMDITSQTPKKLLTMLEPISKKIDFAEDKYRSNGIGVMEKRFSNIFEFYSFMDIYVEFQYDAEKAKKLQEDFRNWLSGIIGDNDATFDIGYSGRLQEIICGILHKPVDTFYIYKSGSEADERAEKNGFRVHTFYENCPALTGALREYFISDPGPSCIGYICTNGTMEPQFEKDKYQYENKFAIMQMFMGAEDFANDIVGLLGKRLEELHFNPATISLPFETFLAKSNSFDRSMFSNVEIEDDVYGGYSAKKLVEIWDWNTNFHGFVPFAETGKVCGFQLHNYAKSTGIPQRKSQAKTAIFYDRITEEHSEISDKLLKCANNTNNLVNWNAIGTLLNPKVISSWYMTNQGGFEKAEFDVFLTTALMEIQENQDLTWLEKVLERIEDKILLPLGISFSAEAEKKDFSLSSDSIATLRKIAERCKCVGVCGEYSAEILSKYGINNYTVIGNPAMYIGMEKWEGIAKKTDKVRNVSASFKPFYGKLSEKEKALLNYYAVKEFDLTECTALNLTNANIPENELYQKMKEYEKKKKIYFSVDAWRKSFEKVDFSIGMNFYNNVMALQSGVPALFINYETAGRELCQYYELPSIDIEHFDEKKTVEEYYQLARLCIDKGLVKTRYEEFRKFLDINNVSLNKMIIK